MKRFALAALLMAVSLITAGVAPVQKNRSAFDGMPAAAHAVVPVMQDDCCGDPPPDCPPWCGDPSNPTEPNAPMAPTSPLAPTGPRSPIKPATPLPIAVF